MDSDIWTWTLSQSGLVPLYDTLIIFDMINWYTWCKVDTQFVKIIQACLWDLYFLFSRPYVEIFEIPRLLILRYLTTTCLLFKCYIWKLFSIFWSSLILKFIPFMQLYTYFYRLSNTFVNTSSFLTYLGILCCTQNFSVSQLVNLILLIYKHLSNESLNKSSQTLMLIWRINPTSSLTP